MSIIDPRTGEAIKKPVTQEDIEEIAKVIQHLDRVIYGLHQRFEALAKQHMELGLLTEFFINEALQLKHEDDSLVLNIDMDKLPEFANQRVRELREQAEAHMKQMQQAEQNKQTPNIKLDE